MLLPLWALIMFISAVSLVKPSTIFVSASFLRLRGGRLVACSPLFVLDQKIEKHSFLRVKGQGENCVL